MKSTSGIDKPDKSKWERVTALKELQNLSIDSYSTKWQLEILKYEREVIIVEAANESKIELDIKGQSDKSRKVKFGEGQLSIKLQTASEDIRIHLEI